MTNIRNKSDVMKNIHKEIKKWKKNIFREKLRKLPERKSHFLISSGIEVERLYYPQRRI
jgi:hypothetical protein